jgi:hypothetical protein
MVEIRYLRVHFCLKLWYGHIQDFWKPTTWIFEGLNTFESWNELNDKDIYLTVEDSDISHTSCTSIEIYILCMQRLQDYCVNCRPPPIRLRLKSSIYNVIYENLVFIKYLIHKVSGSILFCLHNLSCLSVILFYWQSHNKQFTMEQVLFENHKLDCLIHKVKSWLFTHKILKWFSRWI